MAAAAEMMKDNPMLKGLAQGNPELAEMLSDTTKMQEQMAQAAQMLTSSEGQAAMGEMQNAMRDFFNDPAKIEEMKEVMENPEKLSAAMEQLSSALGGLS